MQSRRTSLTVKSVAAAMCFSVLLAAGCSQQEQKPAAPARQAPTPPPAARSEIVDNVTGYTQIKAGQKAKDDINKAAAEHNKVLDEVSK